MSSLTEQCNIKILAQFFKSWGISLDVTEEGTVWGDQDLGIENGKDALDNEIDCEHEKEDGGLLSYRVKMVLCRAKLVILRTTKFLEVTVSNEHLP